MAKISVLMPVYNTSEDFLRTAIDSILNQTFTNFEFLIINDGSTNNAEDVILSYNDERIKYIKNEKNLGLIATLNKGLDIAQGEYIARFDSDDISLPERLAKQCEFLDKNADIGVLGTQYESFPKKRVSDAETDSKKIKEALLVQSNQIGHPTVMFRKKLLDENNIRYDKNALYVEDYKIWLDLIDKTEFANLKDILLKYRRHGGSICSQNSKVQNLNVQKIMFEAQAKYFDLDTEHALNTIEMLKKDENIKTKNLKEILVFAAAVIKIMKEKKFCTDYKLNHEFAKLALKKCKKDFEYFKSLLKGELKIFFEK